MEVQLTDLENAAFTVFVVLVTRVILAFDLNLYIPLSKVDENLKRAHKRSAVTGQRFFWRRHMAPPNGQGDSPDLGKTGDLPPVKEVNIAPASPDAPSSPSAAAAIATAAAAAGAVSDSESTHSHDHAHDHEHNSCHQEDIGYEEMTIYEVCFVLKI
jgi:hypothetical protein